MILPDHLRTANGILTLVGLGKFPEVRPAAALIAVHLANLPPEPEMWGATIEPMSSEDHMHEAVLSACRIVKAVGWVPDAMTVAILATAEVGSAYAARTRPTVDVHVWRTKMSEGLADKLRDLAGIATVATDEPIGEDPELQRAFGAPPHNDDVDPMAPILDEVERVAREAPPIVVEVPPEHAMTLTIGGHRIGGFSGDSPIRVDDLDHHTARVVWQIGDKAGVGPWTTPEEALRAAEAGDAEHGPDTHRVDVDRRVVEKYDEREGWYAVSFDDLRAGDVFRMRERSATEEGPPEIAGCDAYQNERGIWTIRAQPMTPIGEDSERVAVDGAETVTTTPPIVGHVVDVVSVEDPEVPAPKKPRCGLGYGWYETEPPRPMLCGRPEGHNGKCGPAKVVGKKAAEVES